LELTLAQAGAGGSLRGRRPRQSLLYLDNMKVILSTVMICALHNRKSNPYLKGMTYDNSIKKTEMVQHNPPHSER
jgi:hypothetical protein